MDLLWLAGRARRLGRPAATIADLPPPARPGRLAVFVPAWDEAQVIGDMLRGAVAAWGAGDWRLYVGTYAQRSRDASPRRARSLAVGAHG